MPTLSEDLANPFTGLGSFLMGTGNIPVHGPFAPLPLQCPVNQLKHQPKCGAAVPHSPHMQQPRVPQVFYPPSATCHLSQPNSSPTA